MLNFTAGVIARKEISRVQWFYDHKIALRVSHNPLIMFEIVPGIGEANSMGLRDFEYSVKKPKGIYRIAVIGDSIAYGLGVDIKDTFSKQLERKLNENKHKQKYEVINFSVPGYSTIQEAEVLQSNVLKYNPDFVIIAAYSNDAMIYSGMTMDTLLSRNRNPEDFKREAFWFNPNLNNWERFIYNTNLGKFIRYKLAWYKELKILKENKQMTGSQTKGMKTIAEYYSGVNILKIGFEKISKITRRHNIPCLVTYSPSCHEKPGRGIVNRIRNICQKEGLSFLSLSNILLSYKREAVFVDRNSHLNPYGHTLYMREIYKALNINDYF